MLRRMRGGWTRWFSLLWQVASPGGDVPEDGIGVRRNTLQMLDQVQMVRSILRRMDPRVPCQHSAVLYYLAAQFCITSLRTRR